MLTKREVQHIAKLARLGLTEKEIVEYQKELSKILDYIEKLKEIDISKVEPTSHSLELENVMREDKIERSEAEIEKLLEMAPATKKGYLKVEKII